MKSYNIGSVGELIAELRLLGVGGVYWYRGHADVNWQLVPRLGRFAKTMEREQLLLAKFKQNARLLLPTPPSSEFEWLTIMQHHGVPTRLLDWTESPLVGLYFTVSSHDGEDGALWRLEPTLLNKESRISPNNPRYVPSFDDDYLRSYSPTSLASEQMTKLNPIAVIGPRNTPRMQAQLGVFTIMHREPTVIESIGNGEHVKKFVVPKESKESIKKDLEMLGIGKFQLFPELSILGEMLQVE